MGSWERLEEEVTADSLVSGQSYLTKITRYNFIFVVGWLVGPQKIHPLEMWPYLEKRVCVDVIRLS